MFVYKKTGDPKYIFDKVNKKWIFKIPYKNSSNINRFENVTSAIYETKDEAVEYSLVCRDVLEVDGKGSGTKKWNTCKHLSEANFLELKNRLQSYKNSFFTQNPSVYLTPPNSIFPPIVTASPSEVNKTTLPNEISCTTLSSDEMNTKQKMLFNLSPPGGSKYWAENEDAISTSLMDDIRQELIVAKTDRYNGYSITGFSGLVNKFTFDKENLQVWGQLVDERGLCHNLTVNYTSQSQHVDPRVAHVHSVGNSVNCFIRTDNKYSSSTQFLIFMRYRPYGKDPIIMLQNVGSTQILLQFPIKNNDTKFVNYVVQPSESGPICSGAVISLSLCIASNNRIISTRFRFFPSPWDVFGLSVTLHKHYLMQKNNLDEKTLVTLLNDVNEPDWLIENDLSIGDYIESVGDEWPINSICYIMSKNKKTYFYANDLYLSELFKNEGLIRISGGVESSVDNKTEYMIFTEHNLLALGPQITISFFFDILTDSYSVCLKNNSTYEMAVNHLNSPFGTGNCGGTSKVKSGASCSLDSRSIIFLRGGYRNHGLVLHFHLNPRFTSSSNIPLELSLNQKRALFEKAVNINPRYWCRIDGRDITVDLYLPPKNTEKSSVCYIGRCGHCCVQLDDPRISSSVHCSVHLLQRYDNTHYAMLFNSSNDMMAIVYHNEFNIEVYEQIKPGFVSPVRVTNSVIHLIDDQRKSNKLQLQLNVFSSCDEFQPFKSEDEIYTKTYFVEKLFLSTNEIRSPHKFVHKFDRFIKYYFNGSNVSKQRIANASQFEEGFFHQSGCTLLSNCSCVSFNL
jgi:hypothetical protein